MQPNLIRCPRCIRRTSLTPIITTPIRKYIPLRIETGTADTPINRRKTLQPLLIVLIPEIHNAIPSHSGKRPIPLMKTHAIDGIHIAILSMALERKGILPVHFGHVLNPHPPLNASHGVARTIRKGGNAPTLKLELTFLPLVFLRLPLDIVRYNMPPRGGHDHQTIPHVQIVTSFGELQRSHGVGLSSIPKFEQFVPSSGNDEVGRGEEGYGFDGRVVGADLLGDVVGGRLTQLPHAHGFVGSYGEDGVAVGGEAGVEYGRVIFMVDCFGKVERCDERWCEGNKMMHRS